MLRKADWYVCCPIGNCRMAPSMPSTLPAGICRCACAGSWNSCANGSEHAFRRSIRSSGGRRVELARLLFGDNEKQSSKLDSTKRWLKTAFLEVDEGLHDLLARVHHERPMARDGLAQR